MLDHSVEVCVALDFVALALDERAVFFKRLDELQNGAHVFDAGFAHAFELLVYHHGANAVVHVDFEQDGAVNRVRNDVAAFHAVAAGRDAVPEVKGRVGGLFGKRQLLQDALGIGQRQLGVNGVVVAKRLGWPFGHAGYFGHENQLVGVHLAGNGCGYVFHAEVECLARGRKPQGREQNDGALIQQLLNQGDIHLAHQPGVLVIHAIDNAHGPRGNEIA